MKQISAWKCCSSLILSEQLYWRYNMFLLWVKDHWHCHVGDPLLRKNQPLAVSNNLRFAVIFLAVSLLLSHTCWEIWMKFSLFFYLVLFLLVFCKQKWPTISHTNGAVHIPGSVALVLLWWKGATKTRLILQYKELSQLMFKVFKCSLWKGSPNRTFLAME